ncbi:MAG: inosine/xanthosine triphosphatase [Lysobacterales bacterium]|jgi:inosine/xanthosine triphosphatase
MEIVIASKNPVKRAAAQDAFEARFSRENLVFTAVSVVSGVDDQPFSDATTRQGAWNRVRGAAEARPDADFWVGFEGGVDLVDSAMVTFAWVAVRAASGRSGSARTVTLPLPPAVQELVMAGMELGEANDRVFETSGSKHAGGAFGLLTDDRLTRRSVYAEALTVALIPVVNELYR